MKKSWYFIIVMSIFICFLFGCTRNIDNDTKKLANIYVKSCFKDCKPYNRGAVSKNNPNRFNTMWMGNYVCENGNECYIVLNDSLYRYSDGKTELMLKDKMPMTSLVGVTDNKIIYFTERLYPQKEYYTYNTLWINNIETGETKQVFNREFTGYYVSVFDNYLFVKENPDLFWIDLETEEENVIENFDKKSEEEINKNLPEGFYAKTFDGRYNNYFDLEVYKNEGENNRVGIGAFIVDDEFVEIRDIYDYDLNSNWNVYNGDFYVYIAASEIDPDMTPRNKTRGSSERCDTCYWTGDYIYKFEGPDFVAKEKIYSDEKNRIIGFNPETNEVYLYVFDNGTITAKDLDDQTETIIETLDNAEIIEFEWVDTRLYWKYVNNGTEEFGGIHEFDEK